MNQQLQIIFYSIQQNEKLSAEEKDMLIEAVKKADNDLTISEFKLERTEKVKRTTAILLEETIEELEQKRKAVEAQNRELEIEAALEKVRSRSLSMHKSDELQDVVNTVFESLKVLEIDMNVSSIFIFKEGSKDWQQWVATSTTNYSSYFHIPYVDLPLFKDLEDAKKNGLDFYSNRYSFEEKNEWFNYAFNNTGYSRIPGDRKKFLIESEFFLLSFALSKNTGIQIAKYSGKEFSENENEILKRFGRVFEQAYTRFRDLQKAEAQAREAEIELALERVRARTMAMHHTSELQAVIHTVHQELLKLNIAIHGGSFITINDEIDKELRCWGSGGTADTSEEVYIPYYRKRFYTRILKGIKKGPGFFTEAYTPKEKKDFFTFLFTHEPWSKLKAKEKKEVLSSPGGYTRSCCVSEHTSIFIINHFGKKFSEEENDILKRFGKVFEQTYTRFLDLQRAEAQAREAQIQLALERVRARTMAMQNSDELREAVLVINEQLQQLDFDSKATNIIIIDKDTGNAQYWVSGFTKDIFPVSYHVPRFAHPYFDALLNPWKRGDVYVVYEYTGEGKKSFDAIFFTKTDFKNAPEEAKNAMISLPAVTLSTAYFTNGALQVLGHEALSEEKATILQRFAKVFEQTYTRFLDLQKSEAQAREAQIEVSLERVRSRAMAMHKSEELGEAAEVLYKELQKLGITDFINCGYVEIDEQNKTQYGWITNTEGKSMERFYLPLVGDVVLNNRYGAWKRKDPVFCQTVGDAMLKEHVRFVSPQLGSEEALQNAVNNFPNPTIFYCGNFSYGYLCIITGTLFTAEKETLLVRFTRVFEMTYKRFLDLRKAEAQAREAQIEAALERVRSRSLAMHKSDELEQVVIELTNQFRILRSETVTCWIALVNAEANTIELWNNGGGILKSNKTFHGKDNYSFQADIDAFKNEELFRQFSFEKEFAQKLLKELDLFDLKNIQVESTDYHLLQCRHHFGFLGYSSWRKADEEVFILLQRFCKVFEQTYTRFLDLQKAEAQAREAEIQLALERVRARTMAMHESEELAEVVNLLYSQLISLDVSTIGIDIAIFQPDADVIEYWQADFWTTDHLRSYKVAGRNNPVIRKVWKAWEQKKPVVKIYLEGDEHDDYVRFLVEETDYRHVSEEFKAQMRINSDIHFTYIYTKYGFFQAIDNVESIEENIRLLQRFAQVFEQTYTRFLDLQKAEAQAREARTEAALERVRSRAMAMHKTGDFNSAIAVVFDELDKLDLGVLRCGISVLNREKRTGDAWVTSTSEHGSAVQVTGGEPIDIHPLLQGAFETWLRQEDFYYMLEGDDLAAYYKAVKTARFQLPESQFTSAESKSKRQYCFVAVYHGGGLFAFQEGEFSGEAKKVMKRFANVFDLTYKRFLDLQKAEAQTREAQIEAALERVRSKTMAMHNSNDVGATVLSMFDELISIGVDKKTRCGIGILGDTDNMELWTASTDPAGKAILHIGNLDMTLHPLLKGVKNAWRNKEKSYTYELTGEDMVNYFTAINNAPDYNATVDLRSLPEKIIHNDFTFSDGTLFVFTENPIPDELANIFKRFTGVFGQTYRRYMDLLKAEAQAREATIEAALEKVRGKAMAMHNSNDLSVTASMVFTELRKLGINPIRCGVGLLNRESRKAQLYSTTSGNDGDSLSLVGLVELSGHPVLEKIYDTWLKNEDYYPELSGEQLTSYYEVLLKGLPVPVPDSQDIRKQYGTFLYFSVGGLFTWSETPYNEAEIKILKRFATIIDLTFRRYLELQKSEANAREAVKQAALDRVRAEIASMRTISDLDRITPLIWTELTILGIPFIRCGVFIMDEAQQLVHTFLSTPDGKAIAAFHLPYDTPGNLRKVIENWHLKEKYIDHWGDEEFAQFADILAKQGALQSAELYLKTIPTGGFNLHFLPFLQGMLYVGNTTQLGEEEIKSIQSLAEAFSTAYARYEDFNKLEAAKKQVDSTLNDLQVTQKQLIQSEKMASLGELTAGIAHEIQNPLNFVNNFSEVNKELLAEMNEEIAKGNLDEVKLIAKNVTDNEEKINHHGKRADAIVKGMLQHSRLSTGVKEPTDINALCDEYLRLSYHGLRARNNNFNAEIKTDFDESVGKINIVSQDIGRVLLNLFNNAFYAVTEKAKQQTKGLPTGQAGYEPAISVSTKKINNRVELTVKDNGNGIPQKILDKIFQPFFTTKPTGQGTGLGLSLSYDIIKTHGGELKVETKEGEGSEFIIQVPV